MWAYSHFWNVYIVDIPRYYKTGFMIKMITSWLSQATGCIKPWVMIYGISQNHISLHTCNIYRPTTHPLDIALECQWDSKHRNWSNNNTKLRCAASHLLLVESCSLTQGRVLLFGAAKRWSRYRSTYLWRSALLEEMQKRRKRAAIHVNGCILSLFNCTSGSRSSVSRSWLSF